MLYDFWYVEGAGVDVLVGPLGLNIYCQCPRGTQAVGLKPRPVAGPKAGPKICLGKREKSPEDRPNLPFLEETGPHGPCWDKLPMWFASCFYCHHQKLPPS